MEGRCPVVIDPAGTDVHAEAARIRRNGPVAQVELPGGVLAWSITGYEEARAALSDQRFSKDPRKHWTAYTDGEIGGDFPLIGWVLMDNLTTAYGDDHTRLRKLTASAFTPRRVAVMRSSIETLTADLLDELARSAPGEAVDLKARFAHALPAQVICDLFGVPAADRAELLRGGEVNLDTTLTPEEQAANVERWEQQLLDFVADKRRNPDDDLTTDLIVAQDEGSRLNDSEMVGTLHLLLATGTEPVTNLIANAVLALLTHPGQLALLRSGTVSWPDVIEETLRVQAPVAHLPFRFATEDVELGGVKIAKGDPVLVNFVGIGRDPALHGATADVFDATRAVKEHLSFGSGVYRCIGMPLARLEAEIALSALFERFPKLALAVPAERLEPEVTFIMNGRLELPVLLTGAVPANAAVSGATVSEAAGA